MNLCFRLYDPTVGRFLSVDPLFETQIGVTPYHYCGNDPVNFSDPLGLDCDMDLYYGPPAPGDYRSDPETGVMQVWKMKYEDGECGWVFEYGIVNYNNEGDSFAGRQMIIEAPANGKGSSGGGGGSGGSFCSMGWENPHIGFDRSITPRFQNEIKKTLDKCPTIRNMVTLLNKTALNYNVVMFSMRGSKYSNEHSTKYEKRKGKDWSYAHPESLYDASSWDGTNSYISLSTLFYSYFNLSSMFKLYYQANIIHEFAHGYFQACGLESSDKVSFISDGELIEGFPMREMQAMRVENIFRKYVGLPQTNKYKFGDKWVWVPNVIIK